MTICLMIVLGFRLFATAATIEQVYGRAAYPVIQSVLRLTFGWWPFPSMYLWFAGIGMVVLGLAAPLCNREFPIKTRWLTFGRRIVQLSTIVGLWFLLGWGVNYGRVSLTDRLGLSLDEVGQKGSQNKFQLSNRLDRQTLINELELSIATVNALRTDLAVQQRDPRELSAEELLATIGSTVSVTMSRLGYPALPVRRLRILPEGMLLRFGTAGVFSPWTGDPHVDGGLHPLQIAFVAAHEWGHAQGITDEGGCNLVAYIACKNSPDALVVYAAEIGYLRYLRGAVFRNAPDQYGPLMAKLDTLVSSDLAEIAAYSNRFIEIAPVVREAVYDRYLKTQGVTEGMASYSRLIDWVVAARSLPEPLWPRSPQRPQSGDVLPPQDSLVQVQSAN